LAGTNVGFNALHFVSCSAFNGTSATAGFWDDVSFQAVNDPYIVQQPVSISTNYGAAATFSVVAMATSYQWQRNGSPVSGATGSSLTLNPASALNAGTYTCVVTGANGSLTSSAATLTVSGSPPFLTAALVGQKVVITWAGSYPLLSATNVTGPYLPVAGAASPYTNSPPLGSRRFFGLGQ
jgi:Immunoglobulin domain